LQTDKHEAGELDPNLARSQRRSKKTTNLGEEGGRGEEGEVKGTRVGLPNAREKKSSEGKPGSLILWQPDSRRRKKAARKRSRAR